MIPLLSSLMRGVHPHLAPNPGNCILSNHYPVRHLRREKAQGPPAAGAEVEDLAQALWLDAGSPAGSDDDLEEVVQEVRRLKPAAVVVDSPDVKEDYLNVLRSTGVMVVSLDSIAHTVFPSRLVVNPLLGPGRESYEFAHGTQLLLGARYALVRPEIRRQRPTRAQEPAEPFRTPYASRPYDGEIATADDAVGRFITFLKSAGIYDKAIIVLFADHGEGLYDHGQPEHGLFLYREEIHVPLIVKLPKSERAGKTAVNPVGLIDIFPTIAKLCAIDPPVTTSMASIGFHKLSSAERRTRRRSQST